MKWAVTIAKDMTPYFHIEGDDDASAGADTPHQARLLAEELRDAFEGFKEGEEPPRRPVAKVVE